MHNNRPLERFLRLTRAMLLRIGGKCSCFRAKAAHFPGHLPALSCPASYVQKLFSFQLLRTASFQKLCNLWLHTTLQFQKLRSPQLHRADKKILSHLYFAQSGFYIALYEAWHSHTLRCHAFSIAAVASLLPAAYPLVSSVWARCHLT
jgi:hypothetical protein